MCVVTRHLSTMHCRRRINESADGGRATRVPPKAQDEEANDRLAHQTRPGSARITSARRPLPLFVAEHIHSRSLHRHMHHHLIASCSPDLLTVHYRTGLLKNRKRTPRTHRRQYTPLSWLEAMQLICFPSVMAVCAPVYRCIIFRLAVHVSHGHIAVRPPVSIIPLSGWYLILIGRLTSLSMCVCLYTDRGVGRRGVREEHLP